MTSNTQTTRTLAQIAGPFLALVGLAVALRRDVLVNLLTSVQSDPAMLFVLGLITLLLGLVMLVLHHRWRTPLEVVLSALGVLFVIRGAVLLLAPDLVTALFAYAAHLLPLAWIGGVVGILLGGWLAYEGYLKKPASA